MEDGGQAEARSPDSRWRARPARRVHRCVHAAPEGRFDSGIRWLQPERPMWAMGVVVLDVDPQHLLEQLGAGDTKHQGGRVTRPRGDVFHHLQERRLRPVKVIQDQHTTSRSRARASSSRRTAQAASWTGPAASSRPMSCAIRSATGPAPDPHRGACSAWPYLPRWLRQALAWTVIVPAGGHARTPGCVGGGGSRYRALGRVQVLPRNLQVEPGLAVGASIGPVLVDTSKTVEGGTNR